MTLETALNGLLLGAVYGTGAIGLSLVLGVMRLVNLAYGELLIAGAFLAFVLVAALHIDPLVSLAIAVPLAAAIAYPVQRYLLNGLLVRGVEPPLVATFGLSLILQSIFLTAFGGDAKSLSAWYADYGLVLPGGFHVRLVYLIGAALGALTVLALQLLMRRRFGLALRAAASDPDTTSTMGVDTKHVYAMTFAIAAGTAALAGVILGLAFAFTPTTGLAYLLKAVTIVVIGGMGNITGSFVAGIVLGLVETVAATYVGGEYRDFTIYLLLLGVLAFVPSLSATRTRRA